ncbi:YppG family protein [Pseudobacillus wudalianchiensis]|uniref:Uncharacterized protein n=1 Tax=Pseudobacillus wudalianchiensis TaxID=1743143 RepID=A0A1B9AU04_9BACI|nr:YppG family protein [Bacillus wudalianchiensis]OCA87254.1 hypothetical protein A8F95_08350 [Bacillus wudalianchiensis]
MFLGPRRPMAPYSPGPRRRPGRGPQQPPKAGLLSLLQDQEGKMDLAKVTATAKQLSSIYGHVSPLISMFTKRS